MTYPGGLGGERHFDPKNLDFTIADMIEERSRERYREIEKLAILASRSPDSLAAGGRIPDALGAVVAEMRGAGAAAPRTGGERPRTSRYYYDSAWHGDQGSTPQCTAFAALHMMHDGPVTHPGAAKPLRDPAALYDEIVNVDRSEGRFYSEGATSLAMAKAMQRLGWIREYRWGHSLAEFLAMIVERPVLLGIDWYEGMDWPDRKHGIIRAVGRIRGGHEIIANGVDLDDGIVRLKNSWGLPWGRKGHAYLPIEDLEALIGDGGDVCAVIELPTDDPRTKRDERVAA